MMSHDRTEQAYPLEWPTGWTRTEQRQRARFLHKERIYRPGSDGGMTSWLKSQQLTVAKAIERLTVEVDRLGGRHPVLSTNVQVKLNGMPYSGQKEPTDPGAACYFTLKGQRVVLACDRWDRVADNIAAIAAHIYAIRAIERYGVGTLEQAFMGYHRLPPPGERSWRAVLGLGNNGDVTLDRVRERYRELAARHHPDRGGTHEQMAEINTAREAAERELSA